MSSLPPSTGGEVAEAQLSAVDSQSLSRWAKTYLGLVIGAGTAVCVFSAFRLFKDPGADLSWQFFLLVAITLIVGYSLIIKIPKGNGEITVVDTFIFLSLLLYSGEATILLAATEGLTSRLRLNRKPITILFSGAVFAVSTFLTVWTLRLCFGSIVALPRSGYSALFITALGVMALTQFLTNTSLVAVGVALKNRQPVWQTWSRHYLWSSITYFAGASVAGIAAILIGTSGFYVILITTPMIAIIYFTYRMYLKNIETSVAHAEAAAAHAAQAERHIEELSRYIAEQERIREQFTQVEKLSALGELASGVAHNFNNILAIIMARAQLTQMNTENHDVRRALQVIIEAADDGAKVVRRIQDFAQQRRGRDFAPVALGKLLAEVSEITRPRWRDQAQAANVHITLDLQINSEVLVLGDASELRELMVNMVFNAVDAMPSGGRLTLAVEDAEQDWVEVAIGDTGVGMSEDVRSRIFDPFFTTKGSAGIGLGLSVSYGIIRRHEGSVAVESQIGSGTTFRIKLPVWQAGAVAPTTVEAETPIALFAHSEHKHVLVVDDEVQVRQLLREVLESEGYRVTLAENGNEALRLFELGRFDAVFTDIGMPGMSGWELARAIRERNDHIPLAIITGWGEAVSSAEQEQVEIDYIVAKPFNVGRIVEIAREVSRRIGGGVTGAAA